MIAILSPPPAKFLRRLPLSQEYWDDAGANGNPRNKPTNLTIGLGSVSRGCK
ncbi:hypothetical protein BDW69DRAFT_160768 [Aspergillus filifer]